MCGSRDAYWGPEHQIQFADLFGWALILSFNKFLISANI